MPYLSSVFYLFVCLTIIGILMTVLLKVKCDPKMEMEGLISLIVTILMGILFIIEFFTGEISKAFEFASKFDYNSSSYYSESDTTKVSTPPPVTIEYNGDIYVLSETPKQTSPPTTCGE